MWITAGYLLLTIFAFLNLIESINPELNTLNELFPGYSDVMPPVEPFLHGGRFSNFETFSGRHMNLSEPDEILKRSHIVFGLHHERSIISLCHLFDLENVSIAFDKKKNEWLSLSPELARKLGVGRDYELVVARDEAALSLRTTSTNPVYKKAHIKACKKANDHVDVIERQQENLLLLNRTTIEESVSVIIREYSESYDRAFGMHLFHEGNFHLDGPSRRYQPF